MSSTPLDDSRDDVYEAGWRALNKLMRRGFSWSGNERHCAFWQGPDGRFHDVSWLSGLDRSDDGRAAAVVDWDLDGDQDLIVTARSQPRVRVVVNETDAAGAGGGSVTLSPRGRRSNPDAIGARVELELASGRRLVRSVRAGEGYLAQASAWLHFGLGGEQPVRAVVTWPGGERQSFEGLAAGRFYALEEGADAPRELHTPRIELDAVETEPPAAPSATRRVVALEPVPVPALSVLVEGEERVLGGIRPGTDGGRTPLLVVLTASWCAPCRGELRDLTENARALGEAGLDVVALALDQEDERASARAMFAELGWPFPVAYAEPDAILVLDALQGLLRDHEAPLALPTSLLLDDTGRMIVLYEGPVDTARVLDDLRLLGADPAARRDAAAASEGRWLRPPAAADAGFFEGRFTARGLPEVARQYARMRMAVVRSSPASLHHDFGRRAGAAGRWEEAAEHFQRALREDPEYAPAWRDLGVALHRAQRPGPAIDAYRQALRIEEDDDTRYYLGLAFLAVGDRDHATAELERLRAAHSPRAEDLEIAFARSAAPR